jgi:hypothetical protein
MCSSSTVPVFPYQNLKNSTYVDGGTTMSYDPFVAIKRCGEVVAEDSQIVLDVFFLGGQAPLGKADKPKSALEATYRGVEISAFQSGVMNILDIYRLYPDVKVRNIMTSSQALPFETAAMNFNLENMVQEVPVLVSNHFHLKTIRR